MQTKIKQIRTVENKSRTNAFETRKALTLTGPFSIFPFCRFKQAQHAFPCEEVCVVLVLHLIFEN
jgi:hypothetical protein